MNQIPRHIAIICDGNRRWARAHKMEVFRGHEKAVNEVFEPLIDQAIKRGVEYLTFWIFSTENWDRDKKEVEGLMNLFRGFFDKQIDRWDERGIKFNMIGRIDDFDKDIQERIERGKEKTKNNDTITVTLAMSYGGRDELVRAVKKIKSDPQFSEDDISRELISNNLDTAGMPDPELIVRTSGEQRTSGFLLWQSEYSEWWFPEFHFPEFTPEKLDEAITEFNDRKRRFGR